MPARTLVKANSYFEFVMLMRISGQVAPLAQVEDVLVDMAKDISKPAAQRAQ